jgi:hypothetical protein
MSISDNINKYINSKKVGFKSREVLLKTDIEVEKRDSP